MAFQARRKGGIARDDKGLLKTLSPCPADLVRCFGVRWSGVRAQTAVRVRPFVHACRDGDRRGEPVRLRAQGLAGSAADRIHHPAAGDPWPLARRAERFADPFLRASRAGIANAAPAACQKESVPARFSAQLTSRADRRRFCRGSRLFRSGNDGPAVFAPGACGTRARSMNCCVLFILTPYSWPQENAGKWPRSSA
jgi:hypothetical protein